MYDKKNRKKSHHSVVRIRQRTFRSSRDAVPKYYSSKLVIINVLHCNTLLLIILLIFECCRMSFRSSDLTPVARLTLLD